MLLLLGVLLLASVGLAEVLVSQRQDTLLIIHVTTPAGFQQGGADDLADDHAMSPMEGRVNGGPRLAFVYFEPLLGAESSQSVAQQAALHFERLFGGPPTDVRGGELAGYNAVTLSRGIGGRSSGFGIICAADVRGHFVAVVYLGATAFTPADQALLDTLTTTSLRITRQRAR